MNKYLIRSSNYNDKAIVLFVEEYENEELIRCLDINIKFRQPEYFNFVNYSSGFQDENISIEVELTKEGTNLFTIGYIIGYPSKFAFNKNMFFKYLVSLTADRSSSIQVAKIILVFDPLAIEMKNYFVTHKIQYE